MPIWFPTELRVVNVAFCHLREGDLVAFRKVYESNDTPPVFGKVISVVQTYYGEGLPLVGFDSHEYDGLGEWTGGTLDFCNLDSLGIPRDSCRALTTSQSDLADRLFPTIVAPR